MADYSGAQVSVWDLPDVEVVSFPLDKTKGESSQLASSSSNKKSDSTAKPQNVNVDLESIPAATSASTTARKLTLRFQVVLVVATLSAVLVAAGIVLGIYFGLSYNRTTTTSTTATTATVTTATTATTSTATTSTTQTTTTAPCATGYVRTPSGTCVNLLIDFNNCGSIGFVCTSNFTSCSYGSCSSAPAVQLVGGVSAPGIGGSTSADDIFVTVSLPFSISLYGYNVSNASVQTNGIICLGSCSSSGANLVLPTSSFNGPTAFGFWDDLYMVQQTSQTVYYGATGTYPNRELVFEYYTTHFSSRSQIFRFQIVFYEAVRDVVSYKYFQATDGGVSATIGVQASGSGSSMQYSYNTASVPLGSSNQTTPTLIITYNTNNNTVTTGSG